MQSASDYFSDHALTHIKMFGQRREKKMDVKTTLFYTRVMTDTQVVYTYRSSWFTLFVWLPICVVLTAIPCIGWLALAGILFYYLAYPAPGRELRKVMATQKVQLTGSRWSLDNPMKVIVDRAVFDQTLAQK